MAGRAGGEPVGKRMSMTQVVASVDREVQVLELAKAGYTFQRIAKSVGYANSGSAYKAFQRALQKTIQPVADEYRALHLARHEHVIKANWEAMNRGDGEASRVIIAALKGIADLLGLNAPKEIKVNHELLSLADRVADGLSLNPADVLAEAERILVASGTTD